MPVYNCLLISKFFSQQTCVCFSAWHKTKLRCISINSLILLSSTLLIIFIANTERTNLPGFSPLCPCVMDVKLGSCGKLQRFRTLSNWTNFVQPSLLKLLSNFMVINNYFKYINFIQNTVNELIKLFVRRSLTVITRL